MPSNIAHGRKPAGSQQAHKKPPIKKEKPKKAGNSRLDRRHSIVPQEMDPIWMSTYISTQLFSWVSLVFQIALITLMPLKMHVKDWFHVNGMKYGLWEKTIQEISLGVKNVIHSLIVFAWVMFILSAVLTIAYISKSCTRKNQEIIIKSVMYLLSFNWMYLVVVAIYGDTAADESLKRSVWHAFFIYVLVLDVMAMVTSMIASQAAARLLEVPKNGKAGDEVTQMWDVEDSPLKTTTEENSTAVQVPKFADDEPALDNIVFIMTNFVKKTRKMAEDR